jgi:hypothetical protein
VEDSFDSVCDSFCSERDSFCSECGSAGVRGLQLRLFRLELLMQGGELSIALTLEGDRFGDILSSEVVRRTNRCIRSVLPVELRVRIVCCIAASHHRHA